MHTISGKWRPPKIRRSNRVLAARRNLENYKQNLQEHATTNSGATSSSKSVSATRKNSH